MVAGSGISRTPSPGIGSAENIVMYVEAPSDVDVLGVAALLDRRQRHRAHRAQGDVNTVVAWRANPSSPICSDARVLAGQLDRAPEVVGNRRPTAARRRPRGGRCGRAEQVGHEPRTSASAGPS